MILGISASGRKNRMVHQTVFAIAQAVGQKYEVISLAGKRINGCIGCTQCAKDNICKIKDDWNEIGEKMAQADVIIFGAPNYYGTINALGHACLERTFSFRHREAFILKGKIGISVSTSSDPSSENDAVKAMIQRFMQSNQMEILGHVTAEAYSQCYTCGFGRDCSAGSVVSKHGILENIEKCHLPKDFSEQTSTAQQISDVVAKLKSRLQI